jgi:UDP-glucose 4-epimerase
MYLVTGGTGFLGCYVVRDLLRANLPVTVFDVRPDPRLLTLVAGAGALDRIAIVRGDTAHAVQVLEAVRRHQCDTIIHLASPLPPETETDATATLEQMTRSHVNVLEAARMFGMRRVVYASASTSIFGRVNHHGGIDVPVPNDASHHPETLYGICKSTNERIAVLYWNRFGVDNIGLRIAQAYGPGKRRGGQAFAHDMFEVGLRGGVCPIPNVDDLVNWQHADELAALIVRASLVSTPKTKAFNTTGDVLPLRDSIDLLRTILPGASFEGEPGTTGFVMRFDTSRLEDEIGFRHNMTAEEGFRHTVETLRRWIAGGLW